MNAAFAAPAHPVAMPGPNHHHRKTSMFVPSFNIVAGLLAAGLLACVPAQAASGNTSASLNNLQFQLIDLDLTDNITPSITFSNKGSYSTYSVYSGNTIVDEDTFSGYKTRSRSFPNGGISIASTPTSLTAQTHGNSGTSDLYVWSKTEQNLSFTLSPSTRLLFSVQAETLVDSDGLEQGSAYTYIGGTLSTFINGVSGDDEFSSALGITQGKRSRLLQGSLDTGVAYGTGMLTATTAASLKISGQTSPVPEPATYAMLAAGLLVIGAARRKARKA
ncbi:PEP-CTERM sorting domain-containing protein [Massilia sp. P8910]|uniref:PEP-CTERM sorting domain-containing protein n=1 Tax=Massilia antarctica TaxID=2765360 RepID=UPI001E53B60F|nr:PEP-CTERM sorting domain-containing protein [Massilia antarctica]MCE3607949.1 PEP-CTERM sorting domain-containing protein [Massilia antarctica]